MGVELNRSPSGPSVNESLETNIPGVFACGNVLHVHDLVDYVSEEAGVAGKNAAKYIKCGGDHADSGKEIPIVATDGVRYTVPKTLHVANMDDELTVRFRVGGVYKKLLYFHLLKRPADYLPQASCHGSRRDGAGKAAEVRSGSNE